MKFVIRHEIRGRVRVHFYQKDMSIRQADLLHYYLCTLPGVKNVRVYERTADAAVVYEGSRRCILEGIQRFSYDSERMEELVPKNSGRALNREYKEKLVRKVVVRDSAGQEHQIGRIKTAADPCRLFRYLGLCPGYFLLGHRPGRFCPDSSAGKPRPYICSLESSRRKDSTCRIRLAVLPSPGTYGYKGIRPWLFFLPEPLHRRLRAGLRHPHVQQGRGGLHQSGAQDSRRIRRPSVHRVR